MSPVRNLRALPWRSLSLGASATAVYLLCGPAPELWVFDRPAIEGGEWWRLVTGHWVHGDGFHALWDIGALILLGSVFEGRLKWGLVGVLLFASAGVDLWLWWGLPHLRSYCGLSGILNGLLIFGLLDWWRTIRHPFLLLTAAAAAAKIVVETLFGGALLSRTLWASVPTAHAAGFMAGLLLACAVWWVPGVLGRERRGGGDTRPDPLDSHARRDVC